MKARHPRTKVVKYFVDKCLPFGAAISCAIFQALSNAIAHLVYADSARRVINYLDDYFFVAAMKLLCNRQIDSFLSICERIRFPVSLEKTHWACTMLVFLGLLINTVTQTVSLPIDKITKVLTHIEQILQPGRKKITLLELQRLCGSLNFVCRAVVPGRAFTRRLYSKMSGVRKPSHHIRIDREMRLDLCMWRMFMSSPEAYARPFFDFSSALTAEDIDQYSDASFWGAGGFCQTDWYVMKWDPQYMETEQPSINFLELYGVAHRCFVLDREI